MSKYIFFFLSLLACKLSAQTIDITVTGTPGPTIQVQFPVAGINDEIWPNKKSYTLNDGRTASIPNTIRTSGFVHLLYRGKLTKLFLKPGQSIQVEINSEGLKQSVRATGVNADGIILLNSLNHPFYQSKARFYIKQDSAIAGIKLLAAQDQNQEISGFDSLWKANRITADFYQDAKRDVRYYYATVVAYVICREFGRTFYPTAHPGYKTGLNDDMKLAWPLVYQETSLKEDFAYRAPEFYDYARDYIYWYKMRYGSPEGQSLGKNSDTNKMLINTFKAFRVNFSGKALEYLLARYLMEEVSKKKHEAELIGLFNQFKAAYPRSSYNQYLAPLIQDIRTYQAEFARQFMPGQQVLTGHKINTFDDLIKPFNGKTIYVDMWATWCVHCKEEFPFIPELKTFLDKNNIEMLYISMDKDNADQLWQVTLKSSDLKGFHVRTTDSLRNDLINRFWDGKNYSIPRYLIVKDGRIVNADALRPSDKQRLYDQLLKIM